MIRADGLALPAVALWVTALATPAARPAGQQATFRSSIDVVRVDVNVLDKQGRPVTGLGADDFTITVDGKPRKVATAEYIATTRRAEGDAPASKHYSTNVGAAGGRLLLFVIDQGTLPPAAARQALTAADQFVASLNPADRVGLVTIPGSQHVEFTRQHSIVRSLLKQIVGIAPQATGLRQVALTEAFAITRGDQRTLDSVFDRECRNALNDFERRMCRQEVTNEASVVAAEARDRAHNTIVALRSLLTRLAETPDPKTLILISGGLILDRDYSQISWFGPLAARGQVTAYSIFVMPPHFEASLARLPINYRDDTNLVEEGLGVVADLGRGSVFRLITDPGPVFSRLNVELSGYYLLGFEADASDRDGRTHKIDVDIARRSGLDVRARPEFSAGPETVKPIETVLVETLRSPLLASDIRLKATTYTLRDKDSQKLRIVVGAEIDRVRDTAGRLALAFALFDPQGNAVASHVEPDVSTRVNPRTGVHQYFGTALADRAGVYTLKVAVADDLRRRGSVEHTFEAQLASAGGLRIGDLLLVESLGTSSGDVAEPIVSADYTGSALHAIVEVYSERDPVGAVSVTFEIADDENAAPISSIAARSPHGETARPNLREFLATLPLDVLPPGEYVARAIVSSSSRSSKLVRPFRVARPSITPAFLPSRLDRFDRQAVLSTEVVGFFLDRLASRKARASADAVAHARGGRFDALEPALAAGENDELSEAFLSGLAAYSRGEVGKAADRFREALRADSEFFPAAFYLGACLAAAGRDREAANAWRTSLVTESEAPFIYPLIADALLRARDGKGAVTALEEAFERWPEHPQLRVRLASTYLAAGRPADAFKALDAYVESHIGEQETVFLALRAMYEVRAAGVVIETRDEDRARFARYASAYAAAKGPQQALVARWGKFFDGR